MPAASDSPSSLSSSAPTTTALSTGSNTGLGNNPGQGHLPGISPAINHAQPHQRIRSSSGSLVPPSSLSTLNPNAGGFKPGALSALGEVEHETLITPIATSFDGTMASPGGSNQGQPRALASPHQQALPGTAQQQLQALAQQQQQQQQMQQQQFQNMSPFNVFGSPLQTPQHQIGGNHHNLAASNPQEWANYHNVFNAGIGNSNTLTMSPGGPTSTDSHPALAAAALSMSPIQAQLAMLQSMQQQQQMVAAAAAAANANGGGSGYPSASQRQAFALQQQQLQFQALLAAQAQLATATQHGQSNSNNNSNNNNNTVPPRFAQSGLSQPDLTSLASGLTGVTAGGVPGGGGFMAEQLALQAQYETLRQQQQDLLNRFSEMQYQAAQLAQQAQNMSPQQQQQHGLSNIQHTSPPSDRIPLHQPQSQQQQQQQQQTVATAGGGGGGNTTTGNRRGPSHSVSIGAGQTSSGPMGQFALPTLQGNTGGINSSAITSSSANGLAKGHGRRHSVNVAKRDPNLNTFFSFPAGNNNPTQQQQQQQQQQVAGQQGLVNTMNELSLENNTGNDPSDNIPSNRAYGHGRRESRGSIGSLAGWGSSELSDLFNATLYLLASLSYPTQTLTSLLNLLFPFHRPTSQTSLKLKLNYSN